MGWLARYGARCVNYYWRTWQGRAVLFFVLFGYVVVLGSLVPSGNVPVLSQIYQDLFTSQRAAPKH
jgi:hypothetical protein